MLVEKDQDRDRNKSSSTIFNLYMRLMENNEELLGKISWVPKKFFPNHPNIILIESDRFIRAPPLCFRV